VRVCVCACVRVCVCGCGCGCGCGCACVHRCVRVCTYAKGGGAGARQCVHGGRSATREAENNRIRAQGIEPRPLHRTANHSNQEQNTHEHSSYWAPYQRRVDVTGGNPRLQRHRAVGHHQEPRRHHGPEELVQRVGQHSSREPGEPSATQGSRVATPASTCR
jgi:hypothetical protein